jgi:hypothetical protein
MNNSKCVICNKEFVEGDLLQAFLRNPEDPAGSWTKPVEVDSEYQIRHARNQDKIQRKHHSCEVSDSYVPDYNNDCCNCGQSPVVTVVDSLGNKTTDFEMCGPCTFGTAKALDVDQWNTQDDW